MDEFFHELKVKVKEDQSEHENFIVNNFVQDMNSRVGIPFRSINSMICYHRIYWTKAMIFTLI